MTGPAGTGGGTFSDGPFGTGGGILTFSFLVVAGFSGTSGSDTRRDFLLTCFPRASARSFFLVTTGLALGLLTGMYAFSLFLPSLVVVGVAAVFIDGFSAGFTCFSSFSASM